MTEFVTPCREDKIASVRRGAKFFDKRQSIKDLFLISAVGIHRPKTQIFAAACDIADATVG